MEFCLVMNLYFLSVAEIVSKYMELKQFSCKCLQVTKVRSRFFLFIAPAFLQNGKVEDQTLCEVLV